MLRGWDHEATPAQEAGGSSPQGGDEQGQEEEVLWPALPVLSLAGGGGGRRSHVTRQRQSGFGEVVGLGLVRR